MMNLPDSSMKIQRPKLGEWHKIRARAVRRSSDSKHDRVQWESGRIHDPPIEAMYIGYRTVYNGIIHSGHGNYDDYTSGYLSVEKSVTVFLFVSKERQAPFYVLPEDVISV